MKVAIDAGAIVAASVAICFASHDLVFMTAFVPIVILTRMALVAAFVTRDRASLRAEILFLALCTALGAVNDWNSVCNKKIYDYTVPHESDLSSIPIWMLLYWGMILRFVARLARWHALGPPRVASNRVGIGRLRLDSAAVKVVVELLLVAGTRWMLYRFYLDPVLSWLPFLVALLLYFLFFEPTRHDCKLVALFLVGGPAVEMLYIHVGNLHRYHLGWIGGVPLWIVLWWLLIVLIWKDLALRLEGGLSSWLGKRSGSR